MRRSRLVLLFTGGVLAVLLAAASCVVAVLLTIGSGPVAADRCARAVDSCPHPLTVDQIVELTSVDLPEGSEVLQSDYQSAMDWAMTATVRLPEGSAAPALDPDLAWDGSTVGSDGVVREVNVTTAEDGRTVLRIHAFDV